MDEDVVVVNKPASIPVSGVLPELYCQKIVCRIVQVQMHLHITHTYTRTLTRTLLHASSIVFHVVKSLDAQSPLGFSSPEKFQKLLSQVPATAFAEKMIPGARFREVKVPLPLNLEFPDSILLHSR